MLLIKDVYPKALIYWCPFCKAIGNVSFTKEHGLMKYSCGTVIGGALTALRKNAEIIEVCEIGKKVLKKYPIKD